MVSPSRWKPLFTRSAELASGPDAGETRESFIERLLRSRRIAPLHRPAIAALVTLAFFGALVAVMLPWRASLSSAPPAIVLLLPVVLAAALGGAVIGLPTLIGAFVILNLVFVRPFGDFQYSIARTWIVLAIYIAAVVLVASGAASLERLRVELIAQVADYRTVTNYASDIVFRTDVERRILWVSPSAEPYLGRPVDELVGTHVEDLISEADHSAIERLRALLMTGTAMSDIELRLRVADGSERWFTMHAQPVFAPDGDFVGVVGGVRDTHDEQMLKRALQTLTGASVAVIRAESEHELLEETCSVAVEQGGYRSAWYGRAIDNEERDIEVTAQSRQSSDLLIQHIERSWDGDTAHIGPTAVAWRTRHTHVVADFALGADRSPWRMTGISRGVRSSISLPVVVDDAIDGVLTVYASEAYAFDGRAIATLEYLALAMGYGIARLRERTRLEETTVARDRAARQLQQVARLDSIGQLAGGVAHDFNNLLTVQMTYASLTELEIERAGPGGADDETIGRIVDYVGKIVDATRQAEQLTHQLLTFARRDEFEPTVMDPNAAVRETEALLRRVVSSNIQLVAELAEDLPGVVLDGGRLSQVLMNLVVNARDAIVGVGTIRIRTALAPRAQWPEEHSPMVVVEVIDDGAGMSPEVRERALEPFFTTKGAGRGTGLGLSTIYGVVTQAGGSVVLESELGRGTTVRILLPAGEEIPRPAPIAVPELERAASVAGARILVVDDEEDARIAASVILEVAGYRVMSASSGPPALAVLERSRQGVDLLLTDLQMPEMSGEALAVEARRIQPDLRVMYMSGDHAWLGTLHHSGDARLRKPYTRAELLEAVSAALEVTTARPAVEGAESR
jgi:two-component system, cell cycle sensor histidine kinase and response regulator CckA